MGIDAGESDDDPIHQYAEQEVTVTLFSLSANHMYFKILFLSFFFLV